MNCKSRFFAYFIVLIVCIAYSTHARAFTQDSMDVEILQDTLHNLLSDSLLQEAVNLHDSIETDSLINNEQIINNQIIIENNSSKNKSKDTEIDPESYHARRAAKWAVLPGGGQIYNKRWWKVPIAWAMIGAGGYFIYNTANNMRTYNKALDMRNKGQIDEFNNILTEQQIISYRNLHRRNLQLSVFGTVGLWTLTILDAVVDAHLKTYDISDNLSIKFKPKVLRVYNNSVPSFAITLYL